MKNTVQEKLKFISTIFLIVQIALFITLHFVKYTGLYTWWAAYCSICSCFVVSCIYFIITRELSVIHIALFFTLIADLFATVIDDYYAVSITFFILAQICYIWQIRSIFNSAQDRKTENTIRGIVCFFLLIIALVLWIYIRDFTIIAGIIYISILISNVIITLPKIKSIPTLSIGLLLFLLCDFCVAIYLAGKNYQIPDGIISYIYKTKINYSWIFYMPSQTLLTLSIPFLFLKNKSFPLWKWKNDK